MGLDRERRVGAKAEAAADREARALARELQLRECRAARLEANQQRLDVLHGVVWKCELDLGDDGFRAQALRVIQRTVDAQLPGG